ncbi:hypothetical protein BSL78_22097 [Apostichopus japonicus]|uniref:Uncharacterized protein n=1 Tax=Stichopus japonicus TaxID=307972 RepID=A0A2G8JZD3_STIJA|nr:hypothetical protein BSL78_22097 [Apostichopus japonicus]
MGSLRSSRKISSRKTLKVDAGCCYGIMTPWFMPPFQGTVELPLDVNKHGNLAGYGNLRNRRFDDNGGQKVSAADDQSTLRSPPGESASGAVYVRWGHHSCPSSSQLVYTGSAAGTTHRDSGEEVISFAYRKTPFCLAPARVAKLVIPGTNMCPSDGWTREYGGYLMSERVYSSHKRSMHICVDREMQVIPRTDGMPSDYKHHLLDLVKGRCAPSGGGILVVLILMAMN